MPLTKIDISKGVFRTQNPMSLKNSPFCESLVNMFIDQAGANYDRPALEAFSTLDSADVVGMYYFDGVVVCVTVDRKIYTVDLNGTATDITSTTLPGSAPCAG